MFSPIVALGLLVPTPASAQTVAVCAADSSANVVVNAIAAEGAFVGVADLDCGGTTPDLAALAPADVILVWSRTPFDNGGLLGERLADYVDIGGSVVEAVAAQDVAGLGGRFPAAYSPFSGTFEVYDGPLSLGSVDSAHPLLAGISDVGNPAGLPIVTSTIPAVAATVDGSWAHGDALAAHLSPGNTGLVVGLNLSPVSAATGAAGDDGWQLVVNALTWAAVYDVDGDGVVRTLDCAPFDADVFPGAAELCNDTDDDCNGVVDDPDTVEAPTWYPDLDGDGYGTADVSTVAPVVSCDLPGVGWAPNADDCDEQHADVNPGSTDPEKDCVDEPTTPTPDTDAPSEAATSCTCAATGSGSWLGVLSCWFAVRRSRPASSRANKTPRRPQ